MRNVFPRPPGKSAAEWTVYLLGRRQAIQDALEGGSQTSVGIAPGISHDFSPANAKDLRRSRDEYDYALFINDPDNYPWPGKQMKIQTVY